MGRRKSGKKPKPRSVKALKRECTPKQAKWTERFMKHRNATLAAVEAGYSAKYAKQAGHQVKKAVREKAPEVFDRMGISLESVIDRKLLPLMDAQQTIFAQHEGEFSDSIEVDALGIQLGATRMCFELMDAFPPRDQMLAAQIGITIIENDMPRPHRPSVDVQAYLAAQRVPPNGNRKKREEPVAPKNGDEDPRPKD